MSPLIEHLLSENAVLEPADAGDGAPVRVVRFAGPAAGFPAGGTMACPLLEWTAVKISGADAETFLQGQFTNDVSGLASGAIQYNGYCSPKGRLLANFPLARSGNSDYLLLLPSSVVAAIVRRLRMFVLRSKVVIEPLADSHHCFGVHSPDAGARSVVEPDNSGVLAIRLPDGRTVAVCPSAEATGYWNRLTRTATRAGSPVWDWLAIRHGVPVVTAATQDRFVPQMLNWELLGGVSFRKGCYAGQEIVARMQYLGRLKERLYRARTDAGGVVAGGPLYGRQFGEQACGTIVNVAPSPEGGTELLAVIQVTSATVDVIRTASADNAPVLDLLPLPYDVPVARAPQPA